MRNNSACQPIIIIGMHRSGTNMITAMLEKLDLFVGKKKEENHEALFFLQINDWLLRQSGGSWDYPKPIHKLLKNAEIRTLVKDYIIHVLKTPRVTSYMGWSKFISYYTPANLNIPWGWKDPRNTFTLPIWLDVFPKSKVIHIFRNGIDVASSLQVRTKKALARSKALYPKRKWLYRMFPRKEGFTDTLRCIELSGGFSLWTDYLNEAKAHVRYLDSQAMEIKYEDFLFNPFETLKMITYFCNLNASDEDIERVSSLSNKERAYAYRAKPELCAFAEQMAEKLRVFGY